MPVKSPEERKAAREAYNRAYHAKRKLRWKEEGRNRTEERRRKKARYLEKGLTTKGTPRVQAERIPVEAVAAIKGLLQAGIPMAHVAALYNRSLWTIKDIKYGRRWRDVAPAPNCRRLFKEQGEQRAKSD